MAILPVKIISYSLGVVNIAMFTVDTFFAYIHAALLAAATLPKDGLAERAVTEIAMTLIAINSLPHGHFHLVDSTIHGLGSGTPNKVETLFDKARVLHFLGGQKLQEGYRFELKLILTLDVISDFSF